MKHVFLWLVLSAGLLTDMVGQEIDLPKAAKKKVFKTIDRLWPSVNIQLTPVAFDQTTIIQELQKDLKRVQLYKLKNDDETRGYMFLSAAPSRDDYFDLMVIFDTELKISATEVLVYREAYGGEISSKRWLRQFLGKDATAGFRLNYEVQGISGATISVKSATASIKKLTIAITQLQKQGVL